MYVVVYKGSVVLGIIPWNNKYIMDVMRSRYRETIEIPYIEPDASQFPYQVNVDCIIYPAEEDISRNVNPLIEYYYGPTWEFLENKVIAHYEILPLTLDNAKYNYKAKAAAIRYKQEITNTTVIINGINCEIETDRLSRTKFIEKLSISSNEPITWKFKDSWQTITKTDIQFIVDKIDEHVQEAFDTEYLLGLLIDQSESFDDLLAIEVLNIPENVMMQQTI